MLHTAASLKRGWVPASLLITRLKNATPQTPLASALGEYGWIVRTNFILGDCADPAQRARIARQLNKSESLHAMRRHLVIGSHAQLPPDKTIAAATPSVWPRSSNIRSLVSATPTP